MVDVVDVHTRQTVVTAFLTAEGSSLTEIYTRLKGVYSEDATDISIVRCWVRRFKSGEKDIGDRLRPATVVTETKDKVHALIRDDRLSTSELCAATGIGQLAVMVIITELYNIKDCTRWLPKMFTGEHKTARNTCAKHLQRCKDGGDAFLSRIITTD
jgi:hypothetical protein